MIASKDLEHLHIKVPSKIYSVEIEEQERPQQIKMQFSYLHFRHPNILRTSDELSRSNFLLESITPKTSEMKKSVGP